MIACGNEISEEVNWTFLERASRDRSKYFIPNHPTMYAWRVISGAIDSYWQVPANFTCPTEQAVGRWVWKTANACNDFNNVGRSTETFSRSDAPELFTLLGTCEKNPEAFISCFDFKGTWTPTPTPAPAPPPPTPAQCCTGQGSGQCNAPCSNA